MSCITYIVLILLAVAVIYGMAFIKFLFEEIKTQKLANEILRNENRIMKNEIGLDVCGDCIECGDNGERGCPYYGYPDGCSNRACARAYKKLYGEW